MFIVWVVLLSDDGFLLHCCQAEKLDLLENLSEFFKWLGCNLIWKNVICISQRILRKDSFPEESSPQPHEQWANVSGGNLYCCHGERFISLVLLKVYLISWLLLNERLDFILEQSPKNDPEEAQLRIYKINVWIWSRLDFKLKELFGIYWADDLVLMSQIRALQPTIQPLDSTVGFHWKAPTLPTMADLTHFGEEFPLVRTKAPSPPAGGDSQIINLTILCHYLASLPPTRQSFSIFTHSWKYDTANRLVWSKPGTWPPPTFYLQQSPDMRTPLALFCNSLPVYSPA